MASPSALFSDRLQRYAAPALTACGLALLISASTGLLRLPEPPATPAYLQPLHAAEAALGYEGYLGTLQRDLADPALKDIGVLRDLQATGAQAVLTMKGLAADADGLDLPAWEAVLALYTQATGRIEDALASGQWATQPPPPERYQPLFAGYQRLATLAARIELQDSRTGAAWLATRQAQFRTLLGWLLVGTWLTAAGLLLWAWQRHRTLAAQADMVLEGADGESRMVRFGGAAQASFQSLTAELTRTVESLRGADVPATLQTVEELCRALARTVALTHEELNATTEAMRQTGESWQRTAGDNTDSLTQLVAALETRAATVAEIAKLTGTQVQQGLKEIVGAQLQMRLAAGQVADTFNQSGGRAEELGERLLAATNLLRASGKVLQETVDSVRTRMLDATAALTQTDARLTTVIESNNVRLGELADQAEAVLARNAEGQEALASLTAASERISATAEKLNLSENDLSRAVATMLAQSDAFAPLTEQLRELHSQLANASQPQPGVSSTAEISDVSMARLEATADRLAGLADEIAAGRDTPQSQLQPALDQLARLSQLTDTLGAMLGQLEQLPQQLGTQLSAHITAAQPAPALQAQAGIPATVTDTATFSDMAALRINASLQLVQGQVAELLTRLAADQTQLVEQVAIVQRTCEQLRGQRFDRTHLDEALGVIGQQIERSHQGFTGELTGFVTRLEQALAAPLPDGAEDSERDVTPLARAILAKLRGGDGPSAEPSNGMTGAELSLKDALTRMAQIKKLTGALNRQSRTLTELHSGGEAGDAVALASQARELITEVMDAISELSATAATITETADRLGTQTGQAG